MASARLHSLDIVRGITVAGMILVNNGMSDSWEPLRHAAWNGLSIADLVFPFFLFIMGVSIWLSMSRRGFEASGSTVAKILKRTLLLLLIGLAINWFDKAVEGNFACWGELRFWAVLQRIALCYLAVSLWALTPARRVTPGAVAVLLAAYTVLLAAGHGYDTDPSLNILARADRAIFGYAHIYHKSPVDPEGLLGTISATANVMLGFWCGSLLARHSDTGGKVIALFTAASVILLIGGLAAYALPLNKRVWSPSFALVTSGICCALLALVTRFVDMGSAGCADRPGWLLFRIFGTNALALYIASELLAIILGAAGVSDAFYGLLRGLIPVPQLASLLYAVLFVALNLAIGWLLWRRRIFIKI